MRCDVVVVGGGPAGSTAATILAKAGIAVVLVERERFPRPHIGESLLPATLAVLDMIGVLPAVEAAGFTKKAGATMSWGRDDSLWTWYFRETNRRFPHSYQVDRARFDHILLEHSRASGVDVREGAAARAVYFEDGVAQGVVLDDGSRIDAAMVVDASGQAALIARQLGHRVWDPLFRNLAVYAYFDDCAHLPAPDDGNILIESYANGWLWKIPLAGDVSSIGAVVDRDIGMRAIRRLGRHRFLAQQIAAAPRTRDLVGEGEPNAAPLATRDWSYAASRLTGPGYVLIGDAACFVDPLFSTGVHLAVSAAHSGAAYVATALADAPLASEAAVAFERLYRTQYEHFHELARLFYAGNRSVDSYFWEARRITGEQRPPRDAFVRTVSGQAAAGYEASVLSRAALPEEVAAALRAAKPLSVAGDVADVRPALAPGLQLVSTAVLGDGRFEDGYALRGEHRVDLPLSALIAHFVAAVERSPGERTVAALAARIAEENGLPAARVLPTLAEAARLMLSDRTFVRAS